MGYAPGVVGRQPINEQAMDMEKAGLWKLVVPVLGDWKLPRLWFMSIS